MNPQPDVNKMSHGELVQWVFNHPDAKEPHQTPLAADRRRLYQEAFEATDLKQELAEVGYTIEEEVGELYHNHGRYDAALPVLLKWLPRVTYLFLVEEIIRALSVRQAKKLAYPVFLMKFRDPPYVEDPMRPASNPVPMSDDVRWLFGNGLKAFAGPDVADDLIELASDRSFGAERTSIVAALPKTKDDRVEAVLLDLLDDPSVAAYAVEALGKMRSAIAESRIEAMMNSADENVRRESKKALKRIRGQ